MKRGGGKRSEDSGVVQFGGVGGVPFIVVEVGRLAVW
jgi:hypothetical protein